MMMMMISSSITFCLPLIWILFVHTEEEATTKIIKRNSSSSNSRNRKEKKAEPLLLQSFKQNFTLHKPTKKMDTTQFQQLPLFCFFVGGWRQQQAWQEHTDGDGCVWDG
jgi:hypothetical protein